ncbi:MAG: ATP-binding protein, partial [Bacteroidota bacterium]
EIADQRGENYDLATEIDAKDETVSQQQEWIRKLWSKSEIQQKKYEDKISIERELNRNIQEQIDFIKNQEEQIKQTDSIIGAQKEVLESLNSEIEQSKATITRKNVELDMRRRMNWLLGVLVGISLMGGFLLYRGYRTKNRLTKQLRQQNAQMREQSIVLARKNKELEEFAYIASHDLKEPLITISSLIGLLVDDYNEKLDDSGRENLSYISSSAQRMTQLIDALLEYSRIGRRKEYTNVEVSKLVQTLQKDLQHRIQESGAVIHAEDLPMVRGSLVDLRLLFQNLITNAMKFTREHVPPQIEIVATQKGNPLSDANGHWEFSITDNGIGIPEIHKDRIFSIFQRLHASDRYEGTGIGLAHCKKIVESHGGEIWLESTEGEGSTFFFTIPFEN